LTDGFMRDKLNIVVKDSSEMMLDRVGGIASVLNKIDLGASLYAEKK
jgi:hypothetical protein